MQCKCRQSDLAAALKKVDAAVSRKNVVPALAGVLLEAGEDKLRVYATDLDVGVEVFVPAEVSDPGQALPPHKTFKGLVASLPDGEVELTADEAANRLTLSQEKRRYSFDMLDPEVFPAFPDVDGSEAFTLPSAALARAVRSVSPAAAVDPFQGAFACVLLEKDAEKEVLRLVATDRQRLAVAEAPWSGRGDGEAPVNDVLLPAASSKALLDVLSGAAGSEPKAELRFSGSFVVARTDDGNGFFARMGAGAFPNYRLVLPQDLPDPMRIDVGALKNALERAALLLSGQPGKPPLVELETGAGILTVFALDDPSICREEIPVSGDGAGTETSVAANALFLLDAVRPLDGEVLINLPAGRGLIVVRDAAMNYTHAVAPITV
ncbi:DNA polymerase III subunit beta [Moorella sp. E308F]|uniref:DNA polymerase III subunit beta n=1 Tax=unclassified Neomoorella TaxID=2676739 RepID=UPI0010FFBC57|nr:MULTISPECIES: DNA polymerase III subunit beta [unclassified Moorella (in: firmicutes)]GEA15485.1 DNA polymerase III subunit beta [Moorella sp. E308F]GEA19657.1 DNA polymerase III subunit beta [Moorella sp. E306M]